MLHLRTKVHPNKKVAYKSACDCAPAWRKVHSVPLRVQSLRDEQ